MIRFLFLLLLSFSTTYGVEHTTQAFLDELNASKGPPMEKLSPKDARAVLEKTQASAQIELPKADVSEKTITVDGSPIKLTIVRPMEAKDNSPVFMFFH